MPAYNAAAYIEAAIASVRRQTVTDFELIVIDDGSSDRTAEVVGRIAAADPRVRLMTKENGGPGPARNAGFHAARAPLLAFLDSDDEWAPAFLERQLAILQSRPDVDVVFGNAWARGGVGDGQPVRPLTGGGRLLKLADLLADDNLHFIMVVFRRSVIDRVGGFDPAFLTNEEYELWLRAGLAGFTFIRNAEPLGWYTRRPGSLSASDTRMLRGVLRVLASFRPALPSDSRERAILERQVRNYEESLAAAEARDSLARGDRASARTHLAALHARRGGWLLALAARLPAAAIAAYHLREQLRSHVGSAFRHSHVGSGFRHSHVGSAFRQTFNRSGA
jgi:glycosyltransferase involved in cell wall biosynthesis